MEMDDVSVVMTKALGHLDRVAEHVSPPIEIIRRLRLTSLASRER